MQQYRPPGQLSRFVAVDEDDLGLTPRASQEFKKEAVGYKGNADDYKQACCGICVHFQGQGQGQVEDEDQGQGTGRCELVEGEINALGWCRLFNKGSDNNNNNAQTQTNTQYARRSSSGGNPEALRSWYDQGAKGQINWGSAGDFARCVEIASQHMSDEQAKGFCNERHQDATGAPPGHAPSEERESSKSAHAKASKDRVRYKDRAPNSNKERCGLCTHFREPGSCKLVEGNIKPGGVCVWFKAETTSHASGPALVGGASASSSDIAPRVRDHLSKAYAAKDLDWVDDAEWTYDPTTYVRQINQKDPEELDQNKVSAIAKMVRNGEPINPVVLTVGNDGHYGIVDGNHRVAAYKQEGHITVPAYIAGGGAYGPWSPASSSHAAPMQPGAGESSMTTSLSQIVKFKNYSKEQRQEFVKKGWALPDEDSGGAFPIADKEDLEDALHRIGTTKHPRAQVIRHIRKRAKELGATDMLGEKTGPQSKHAALGRGIEDDHVLGPVVQFATEREITPRGTVVRIGKVFEAGRRLDMHGQPFEVTAEDLWRMNGKRIPLGAGHPEAPSVFDGKMGEAELFVAPDNPNELWAEAETPLFVDDVLVGEYGSAPAPVSMLFHRMLKEPIGLDFVNDPNVIDAALAASFARHDTQRGQQAMQRLHDVAVQHGAVCNPSNVSGGTAAYASAHEYQTIQAVHDMAAQHGARCDIRLEEAPAGNRSATTYNPDLRQTTAPSRGGPGGAVSGFTNRGNSGNSGNNSKGGRRKTKMGWNEVWKGLFSAARENPELFESDELDLTQVPDLNPATRDAARMAANDPRVAQLEAELSRERAHRIESEAVAFAEREVKEHRSLPNEQEGLVEIYRQAALDDLSLGTIKFAAPGSNTVVSANRTDRLKAIFAARSEHWLTKEMLEATVAPGVLQNFMDTRKVGQPEPSTPERKAKLLEHTPLGRSAIAAANKK